MAKLQPFGRLSVLVVEDEPVLRLYVLDMVEEAGFEAVEATSAVDAIRILETRTDIRIVYMDLDMPRGLKGIEIAAAIRNRWPPIEIILTAAFLTRDDVELPERAEFYPKPIKHDQMIGAMRRMKRQLYQDKPSPGTRVRHCITVSCRPVRARVRALQSRRQRRQMPRGQTTSRRRLASDE